MRTRITPNNAIMKRHYTVKIHYTVECESIADGARQVAQIMEMTGFQKFAVKHIDAVRSTAQNSALWKYFTNVEAHCQERGLTIEQLYKNPLEIIISKHLLHQWIVELIQFALGKDGTSKLNKKEFSAIIKKTQDEFGTRLDFHEPFPSMANYYEIKK